MIEKIKIDEYHEKWINHRCTSVSTVDANGVKVKIQPGREVIILIKKIPSAPKRERRTYTTADKPTKEPQLDEV